MVTAHTLSQSAAPLFPEHPQVLGRGARVFIKGPPSCQVRQLPG